MKDNDEAVFRLKDGRLWVSGDRLVIVDKYRIKRQGELWMGGLMLLGLSYMTYHFFVSGTRLVLLMAFFLVDSILQLVKVLLRTSQREVMFADIRSVKEMRRFGSRFVDIRLKNRRIRRFSPDDNSKQIVAKIMEAI